MKKVYVGGSLLNAKRINHFQDKFKAAGHIITYDWTVWAANRVVDEQELAKIGLLEANGVKDADLFFMVQPGRTGTHWEGGIASALGIPIVILEEGDAVEKKPFYYLPNVHRHSTEENAFNCAIKILNGEL